MPRYEREKLGDVYRVRKVKTFWEAVGDFVGGLIGLAFIVIVAVAIFS